MFMSCRVMVRMMIVACAVATCTAQAATIHVAINGNDAGDGLTWATAKRTVQAGLNAAQPADRVWVAAGTYDGTITLKTDVAFYGGFTGTETDLVQRNWTANETILNGTLDDSVVVSPQGATEDTRIDGFTIRNGRGRLVRANVKITLEIQTDIPDGAPRSPSTLGLSRPVHTPAFSGNHDGNVHFRHRQERLTSSIVVLQCLVVRRNLQEFPVCRLWIDPIFHNHVLEQLEGAKLLFTVGQFAPAGGAATPGRQKVPAPVDIVWPRAGLDCVWLSRSPCNHPAIRGQAWFHGSSSVA